MEGVDQAVEGIASQHPFTHSDLDEAFQFRVKSVLDRITAPPADVLSVGAGGCKVEGVLSALGYDVTAVDDLDDPWHRLGTNADVIKSFADESGIAFVERKAPITADELPADAYDVVIALDVIEHLHESPREFLNFCVSSLRPGGELVLTTPNAVHSGARLKTLLGRNSAIPIERFYWTPGPFRGHVREYTPDELEYVLSNHDLANVDVSTVNVISKWTAASSASYGTKAATLAHELVSRVFPRWRDSIVAVAERPAEWSPTEASAERLSEHSGTIRKYAPEDMSDAEIREDILAED